MQGLDFAPLLRGGVGFDYVVNLLDSLNQHPSPNYPPYNIEKTGSDTWKITLAVAGFTQDDIDIVVSENRISVAGKIDEKSVSDSGLSEDSAPPARVFLHQGIAERAFRRDFSLADHVKVVGAELGNGLLHIDLERQIPENMKPRKIEIRAQNGAPKLDNKKRKT